MCSNSWSHLFPHNDFVHLYRSGAVILIFYRRKNLTLKNAALELVRSGDSCYIFTLVHWRLPECFHRSGECLHTGSYDLPILWASRILSAFLSASIVFLCMLIILCLFNLYNLIIKALFWQRAEFLHDAQSLYLRLQVFNQLPCPCAETRQLDSLFWFFCFRKSCLRWVLCYNPEVRFRTHNPWPPSPWFSPLSHAAFKLKD